MGATASAELRTAEATILRLEGELKAASAVMVRKEGMLSKLGSELDETKTALASSFEALEATKKTAAMVTSEVPRLEEALKGMRSEAEIERAKARDLESELRMARDELERRAGAEKLRFPKKGPDDETVGVVVAANRAVRDASGEEERHPIFGKLVHDFGYKKLYVSDPRTVWTGTALWAKQRSFRQDRAAMIADSKKSSSVAGWPGALSVVESSKLDDSGFVVDGQHRLGAAWLLADSAPDPALGEILVEVYPPTDDKKVFDLFAEINKAEPVALVDMPAEFVDGGSSDDVRERIDHAAESLKALFPDMFKPSKNCRAPHLNLDALREKLHEANLAADKPDLLRFLLDQNDALAKLPPERWAAGGGLRARANSPAALDAALAKASKFNFFLGLTWEWLNATDLH